MPLIQPISTVVAPVASMSSSLPSSRRMPIADGLGGLALIRFSALNRSSPVSTSPSRRSRCVAGKSRLHALDHRCARRLPRGTEYAPQHGVGGRQNLAVAEPLTRAHQQRARPVEALCLAPKESRQILGRPAVERPQAKVVADPALMSSDRLPPFGVVLDRVRIRSQLKGCEPQHLAVDLEGLLVREAPEDTNKGDLVGEAQSIGDAAAAGDLLPVALKEAAIADQPGAGDVEVGRAWRAARNKRSFQLTTNAIRNGTRFLCRVV